LFEYNLNRILIHENNKVHTSHGSTYVQVMFLSYDSVGWASETVSNL